jgi:transposase
LATGSELGSRLAGLLAMPASGNTLPRLIRAVSVEPAPPARIIVINDLAWRRGKRYGTLIVDLERRRTIDLLPDRQADTLAVWLKQHPSVEIVARGRAGAYVDGVPTGGPEPIQVAVRFHLLRNLGDAVGNALNRYYRNIRAAAKAATNSEVSCSVSVAAFAAVSGSLPKPTTKRQQHSLDKQAARRARFDEVLPCR